MALSKWNRFRQTLSRWFRPRRDSVVAVSEGPAFSRCPLNAEGPFYTLGLCLACGLPEDEAPELLAPLGEANGTTYFLRQPKTPDEIERACNAITSCCVDDIRYGGTDREIINRLGNDPQYCDHVVLNGQLIPVKKACR